MGKDLFCPKCHSKVAPTSRRKKFYFCDKCREIHDKEECVKK